MKNSFNVRLKELRQEKGYSQVELAKKLQVSKGIISFWGNGLREPTLTNLIAISKVLDTSIDYLAGLTD